MVKLWCGYCVFRVGNFSRSWKIWLAATLQLSFLLPTEKVSADNCISLFAPLVLHAWTHQEVRGMMHHLKERGRCWNNPEPVSIMYTLRPGMNSFIKEYVLVRNIPIPKLLYAFGICLVSQFLHWLAISTARSIFMLSTTNFCLFRHSVRNCARNAQKPYSTSWKWPCRESELHPMVTTPPLGAYWKAPQTPQAGEIAKL